MGCLGTPRLWWVEYGMERVYLDGAWCRLEAVAAGPVDGTVARIEVHVDTSLAPPAWERLVSGRGNQRVRLCNYVRLGRSLAQHEMEGTIIDASLARFGGEPYGLGLPEGQPGLVEAVTCN